MKRFFVSRAILALGVALLAGCGMCGDTPYDPTKQFCDTRDNHVYKFVTIGKQTWMAQNLNYETATGSYCYNDSTEYCQKYGRLYTWVAAIDKSEEKCGSGKNCNLGNGKVRGACPEGWHLPDTTEWKTLFTAVGGGATAGTMLKSAEGWNDRDDGTSGNGTDAFGFSTLPAGRKIDSFSPNQGYANQGAEAYIWTSTEDNSENAYSILWFNYADFAALHKYYSKKHSFSVRCVKDSSAIQVQLSSSSTPQSSSSSIAPVSSSSSSINNPIYNSLTDNRDGQTYKTVKIGEQWWMAQNLNYKTATGSYCYNDSATYCQKYGRLYTWATAVGKSEEECGEGVECNIYDVKIRGVCPEGWHLPKYDEIETLVVAVGGVETAGKMLKSTEGWKDNRSNGTSGNGTDAFGFSALPAGYHYKDEKGDFVALGGTTDFWTSTENGRIEARFMNIVEYDRSYLPSLNKGYAYSVRCLKD
jgi:uncharacterized protein (TIGR02145 family)